MKQLTKTLSLLFSLYFLFSCAAPIKTVKKTDLQIEKYKKVAVVPFQGIPTEVGKVLSEYFITEVMDMGFNVIERTQLEKILKEQNISLSGIIDTETIHKIGKIIGVDALVVGSFHCRREKREVTIVSGRPRLLRRPLPSRAALRQKQLRPAVVKVDIDPEIIFSEISVRFVDIETGEILISSVTKKEYTAETVRDCLSEITNSIKKKLIR